MSIVAPRCVCIRTLFGMINSVRVHRSVIAHSVVIRSAQHTGVRQMQFVGKVCEREHAQRVWDLCQYGQRPNIRSMYVVTA